MTFKRLFTIVWVGILYLLTFHSISMGYDSDLYDMIETPELILIYPTSLQPVTSGIIKTYFQAKENLQEIFQWQLHGQVHLILINNRQYFLQMAEHPLTVAFAESSRKRVIIDYQTANAHPFQLETTLQHELCHLLLREHIPGHIPRWLNEGIAQWASEGISEIIRPDGNILQKATFSGNLIPFYRLERSFPMNSNDFVLAYEQSQSFVIYLVNRYGKPNFMHFLNEYKRGSSLYDAFNFTYQKSFRDLETEWVRSQTQFFSWILFLINNLYTFLFVGMALVSIYGFIRMKRRKWMYPDDWDEEEDDDEG